MTFFRVNEIMTHIGPFTKTDEDYAALVAINEVLVPDEQLAAWSYYEKVL